MKFRFVSCFSTLALLASASFASADATGPSSPWSGSLSAGLALTRGNTDTSSFNLALAALWDPKADDLMKADVLYIKSTKGGEATVDRKTAGFRYERKLMPALAAFGEVRYMADRFQGVDSLISPAIGVSWTAHKNDAMNLTFDGGYGWYWEKLADLDRTDGGAYRAGESFSWKISETSVLSQSVSGLWKSKDTGDAIYHGEIALSTSMTSAMQLKAGFVDDYRSRPAAPELKKNDLATVAALVVKF